jgi:hypothetical protein
VDDPVFMYSLLMMAGVLLNIALSGAVIYVVVKVFGDRTPSTAHILRITSMLQTSEGWKNDDVVGVPEV